MKRRIISAVLSLIMVLSTLVSALGGLLTAQTVQAAETAAYRNVGYYASWAGYARNYPLTKMDFSKITHLNFAFANLKNDGSVVVGDEWIDTQITSGVYADMGFTWEDSAASLAGHFGALKKIKAKYPHLKTIISIGGWTWSNNFSDVAADATKRAKMAKTAVDFIVKYGFDGVDLDWEYPVEGGNNIPHRAADKHNYTLLVKAIREALDAQSAKDGKTYYLTIAAGGNPTFVQNTEPLELMKYLDWINLMTYDYHGGFDPQTNHNTPLFLNPNDTTGSTFSIDQTVNAYLNAGVAAKDLNLGLGFYGRGWINVNATPATCLFHNGSAAGETSAGLDIGSWEGSNWDYWDITTNYIGKRGYVRYWDDYAKVPYLYSAEKKVFITYDDPESINIKIDYLMSKGLGGAMFWEASSDKYGELLGITASRLGINGEEVIPPTDPVTPTDPTNPTDPENPTNPETNTYDSLKVYTGGDRVVYNGVTYEAKWWTQGETPDANNQWGVWKVVSGLKNISNLDGKKILENISNLDGKKILENVSNLDDTKTPEEPTNPTSDTYDKTKVYVGGDRVVYNGVTYEAKWWTQGDIPDANNQWGVWKLVAGTPNTTDPTDPTDPTEPTNPTDPETPIEIPSDGEVDYKGLPQHLLTGYWQNFDNNATCLKISQVPATYNLIAVAFADATSTPGEVIFQLDSTLSSRLGGYTKQQFIQDIANAKKKGQKVIISVGGEVGNVSVTNATQATNFANSVYALMQEYGFDGVDIDLEHGINSTYMASALRQLSQKAGSDLIITMAPQTLDMQNPNTEYFKLAIAIKDILTIVNTQYYNSGSMLGQDGQVYSQGTVDFLTALAAIQLENGLRPDQIGLGLPASSRGAGSGYVAPSIVNQALECLATGAKGGKYVPVHTYPGIRGAMTWSINWDASNGYQFANTVLATLNKLPVVEK